MCPPPPKGNVFLIFRKRETLENARVHSCGKGRSSLCVFSGFPETTWKWAWPQNQLAKPAQGVRKTYLAVVHSAPRRRLCSDDGRDNDVRHSAHDWRDLMRDAVRDEERRDNLFAPAAHKRTERRALKC
jgi:hypothetical protein